jgi:nicotinamidase-related amidase
MTSTEIPPVPARAADVLDARSCALVLWDLQNGLGGHAPRLPELSPVWQRLREAARASGVLIMRSRHVPPRHDVMDPVERWRISRRKHGENRPEHYLLPGSHDAAFIPGLEPWPEELVIDKAAPSLFHGTPADARLRGRGIRTVVLAGVATDIGIDFTVRHAMALGYFPVIAEDAVAGFTDTAHEHAMAVLRSIAFAEPSDKIIALWARTGSRS